ncbi:UDP-N-acetylmuramoyl-L-alanyl-D-glutamate--L-lysine ligase, partial [Enterococcus faecalis]|nr:UDP-N-acetylmuramoyl-L-alanyl-D-glutamate--L-lysine ligase [Enterococcus faecalis]
EIQGHITKEMPVYTVLDRGEAIAHALSLSTTADDAIVLAGKGADLYQKVNGVDEPYAGDFALAKMIIDK